MKSEAVLVDYYFCEPPWAGTLSAWCIRPRGPAGVRKTGGGADTASLCGRVKPPTGWDLEIDVKFKDVLAPSPYVCKRCVTRLKKLLLGHQGFSIEGKSDVKK